LTANGALRSDVFAIEVKNETSKERGKGVKKEEDKSDLRTFQHVRGIDTEKKRKKVLAHLLSCASLKEKHVRHPLSTKN